VGLVFVGKAFRTLQLDDQRVLDEEVREILSHRTPFVDYGKK
jgi:hypothetical protein